MNILKIVVLGCWGHQFAIATGAGPDLGKPEEEGSAACMLAKKTKRTLSTEAAEETEVLEYKAGKASPAMKYFKDWSKGFIDSLLLPQGNSIPMLVEEREELMTTLMDALTKQKGCSRMTLKAQKWSLIQHEESDGVDHLIFKKINTQSNLQYIAKRRDRIIVADPPMECTSELQRDGPDVLREPEQAYPEEDGGARVMLHPENDGMVQDCKRLYERTVDDICKKKIQVKVLQADRRIIDGIEVDMDVEVVGPAGKTTRHAPSCFFELYPHDKDASLLQDFEDPADTDPIEAEKKGMTATLRAFSDLCKADEEDGKGAFLGERPAMGFLGFYRGYEHVDDQLPKAKVAVRQDLPQDVDLRTKYPKCFKQGGREVIRNQGNCGSCWAFAAASSLMNTLCTSKEDSSLSYADPTDRYEVSVQQIMSCNAAKKGCDGGTAFSANQALLAHGISKEREQPYQCGRGNPLHHFKDGGACKKWPWGSQCGKDRVEDWMYGGGFRLNGEKDMMTLLSQGQSLYVSMKVDDSFCIDDFKTKVYTGENQRGKPGGHAMAGIGYGVQDGVKYWLIQNSWGASWNADGVIKVKRGVNLNGIETSTLWFRGAVKGASFIPMECADSTELIFPDRPNGWLRCTNYEKHECNLYDYLRTICPVLCDACPGTQAPAPQPTPQPAPVPQPTPQPAPTGGCDFLRPHSRGLNNPLCSDGTLSWHCVTQNHGHRVKCPSIAPYMCAKKDCDAGSDHCCEASEAKCGPYGGLRLC